MVLGFWFFFFLLGQRLVNFSCQEEFFCLSQISHKMWWFCSQNFSARCGICAFVTHVNCKFYCKCHFEFLGTVFKGTQVFPSLWKFLIIFLSAWFCEARLVFISMFCSSAHTGGVLSLCTPSGVSAQWFIGLNCCLKNRALHLFQLLLVLCQNLLLLCLCGSAHTCGDVKEALGSSLWMQNVKHRRSLSLCIHCRSLAALQSCSVWQSREGTNVRAEQGRDKSAPAGWGMSAAASGRLHPPVKPMP